MSKLNKCQLKIRRIRKELEMSLNYVKVLKDRNARLSVLQGTIEDAIEELTELQEGVEKL